MLKVAPGGNRNEVSGQIERDGIDLCGDLAGEEDVGIVPKSILCNVSRDHAREI